ncbi:hypothetical protein [Methylocella silvestris]|uniref:Uncharacterized protein n=1 Tax=Methylocella silvestris TaxID=199596 RepID=A0A2J7THR5_METSI|nr:hypothetical protein [Methylocella silvestris]PNG26299.1 hypothetical protein CR492_09280 [Methylocella silvestris]
MNGWIVTWDGTDADLNRNKIVAVYDSRWGATRVKDLIEQLYILLSGTTEAEKLAYARIRKENPYPAEIDKFQRINCGHNPFLFGRRVKNILLDGTIYTWEERDYKLLRKIDRRMFA